VKASDYIADFLAEQGVRSVFEMTGGMITHLLDSLAARGRVAIVSVHHEQAAAFAAEAGARMTGVPGVAFATSGPGATNLLTGVGSCFFDSVPAIFHHRPSEHVRAVAGDRREAVGLPGDDIVAVAGPITKAAWRVTDAATCLACWPKRSGSRSPVGPALCSSTSDGRAARRTRRRPARGRARRRAAARDTGADRAGARGRLGG